ncbi:MAG: glutamine--fructose-6-phosphate transaminase (isomerizing) [Candidatus Tectomicrobia bacterium]|nr:glutamine--fructose-6-phosphate transaminase (isomerizing) [Candidatus Tectomicrobia bacterium]
MSGIMGYVGHRAALPVLLEGLKRLEYRGYDSVGVGVIEAGALHIQKTIGTVQRLERQLRGLDLRSTVGIGHTRWATHGQPTLENAHPHASGRIAIVHNGIIANYLELRQELIAEGVRFASDTDSEVIAALIDRAYRGDLAAAVLAALPRLSGTYALGVICRDEPNVLLCARQAVPLVVGLGVREAFLASDVTPFAPYTQNCFFLDDGEVGILSGGGVQILDLRGQVVPKEIEHITWNPVLAEKGGYRFYMLKEIFETPQAVRETLRGRLLPGAPFVHWAERGPEADLLRTCRKVILLGCGSSYHAALIGKLYLEEIAGLATEVELGSEFRYRTPLVDRRTIVIGISQSGETADTLAGMRAARASGATIYALTNAPLSTAAREADGVLRLHAGPEISVASTKTFVAELAVLCMLALHAAHLRRRQPEAHLRELAAALGTAPAAIEAALAVEEEVEALARRYSRFDHYIVLGRGVHYPVALEAALKIKELSYVHAEGCAAGEVKQGLIALVDERVPVLVLAPQGRVYEKTLDNLEEVKARGARIVAIGTQGDVELRARAHDLLELPRLPELLSPLCSSPLVHLFAYHLALRRRRDVDHPRNLAKSVTVE